ncbi:MAG: hypothetical protein HY925_11510, partial [Elusimicrobia bacterium]|nr:hypothetical protein [Elusimicrobiota bacterium]
MAIPPKRGAVAALAAVLVSALLVARTRPRPSPSASPKLFTPVPSMTPAPEEETPEEDHLYLASAPMSIRDFLGAIEREAGKEGREFAREFSALPKVRDRWEAAGETPAGPFLAALGGDSGFRDLMLKFDSKPAFRNAWASLQSKPEFAAAIQREAPAAAAAMRRAPAAVKTPKAVGAKLSPARMAAVAAGFRSRLAQDGFARAGAATGFLSPGPAEAYLARFGGAANTLEDERKVDQANGAGKDPHTRTPLEKLKDAGPDKDARQVILSAFAKSDPDLTRQMLGVCIARIATGNGCDIADLCRAVSLQRCRDACAAAGAACTVTIPPDPPPQVAVVGPGNGGNAVVGPCSGPGDP